MTVKQGEIYLVNFDPSFGHEYKKLRPALIIENSRFIPQGNLITLIPLSSKTDKSALLDVFISKDNNNRIYSDSLIKVRQISSFDKKRLLKKIGICNEIILAQAKKNIDDYLELDGNR